ncbi:MAG: hypothetical protein KC503_08115 [Myxococcales bacterium]|nr:hypothetical protein [Myxococcales bacterium]
MRHLLLCCGIGLLGLAGCAVHPAPRPVIARRAPTADDLFSWCYRYVARQRCGGHVGDTLCRADARSAFGGASNKRSWLAAQGCPLGILAPRYEARGCFGRRLVNSPERLEAAVARRRAENARRREAAVNRTLRELLRR